jgi:hypothetical protein
MDNARQTYFGPTALPEGAPVRVRNRFDGSWVSGFVVDHHDRSAEARVGGYVLRRLSDGSTLPVAFYDHELAPEP